MAIHRITLTVNGEHEIVNVPSNMTLLRMLRETSGANRYEKWLFSRGMWVLYGVDQW